MKKELPLELFTIYVRSIFKPKGGFQGKKKIEWERFKKIHKEKIFKPVDFKEQEEKTFFNQRNVKLDNIISFSKLTFGGGWYTKRSKLDLISSLFLNTRIKKYKKTIKNPSVHFLRSIRPKEELKIFYLDKKNYEKIRKRIYRLEKSNLDELKKLIRISKIISEIFYLDKKISSKRIKTLRREINEILFRAMTIANQKQMKKELKLYQKIWRVVNDEIKRTKDKGARGESNDFRTETQNIRRSCETIDF
ncbi:MAG: hypothetical protein GXO22_04385 [Aquificae bacterium]|nr:hypothetical protein [Aquificota bacterium]